MKRAKKKGKKRGKIKPLRGKKKALHSNNLKSVKIRQKNKETKSHVQAAERNLPPQRIPRK